MNDSLPEYEDNLKNVTLPCGHPAQIIEELERAIVTVVLTGVDDSGKFHEDEASRYIDSVAPFQYSCRQCGLALADEHGPIRSWPQLFDWLKQNTDLNLNLIEVEAKRKD